MLRASKTNERRKMRIFKKIAEIKTDCQLSKRVPIRDVKGYLEDEFERAKVREEYIVELEDKLKLAADLRMKYDAMLVVQEKVSERVKRQDERIKKLKEELKKELEEKIKLKAKLADLRINAKKVANRKCKKTIDKPKAF